MAFPTTPVLDNANRADENPISQAGAWTTPTIVANPVMKVVSNQIAAAVAAGVACRTSISTADVEVFADVPVLATAGNAVGVWYGILNPGNANANITDCYLWIYVTGTGFQHYKRVGGTYTQIGSTFTSHTFAAGEQLGARRIGTTIEGFYGVASSYTSVDARTDTSVTGAGTIGAEIDDTTGRIDNFGGGAPVTSTPSLILDERRSRRNVLLRL